MQFHVYKNILQTEIRKTFGTRIDTEHKNDKYAVVAIHKESCIIRHLPKGETRKDFIFLFMFQC